jgi:hypothetical protein
LEKAAGESVLPGIAKSKTEILSSAFRGWNDLKRGPRKLWHLLKEHYLLALELLRTTLALDFLQMLVQTGFGWAFG